jgi:tRNA(Ile)-lysidine synthetase-like protein
VGAPEGPLVVRSRQVGDRVRAGNRDVSLKRFLMDRRVPADLRPRLPLVAAGNLVLWVPGQPAAAGAPGGAPLAPPSSMTKRFVRLELLGVEAGAR